MSYEEAQFRRFGTIVALLQQYRSFRSTLRAPQYSSAIILPDLCVTVSNASLFNKHRSKPMDIQRSDNVHNQWCHNTIHPGMIDLVETPTFYRAKLPGGDSEGRSV